MGKSLVLWLHPLGCSFIVYHASKPCGTAGEASLLAPGMANKL